MTAPVLSTPGPAPVPAVEPPFVPAPVRRRLLLAVFGGAIAAMTLLASSVIAANRLSWVHRAPLADPIVGINFSCTHAEYLLLEDPALGPGAVPDDRPGRAQWCADTFATILRETGARHVRLSVEWREVEPAEGVYDFATLDALLRTADAEGAQVLLTVGIKAQRHPEYYIPAWAMAGVTAGHGATVTDDVLLRARALAMVERVVAHAAGSAAIEAWGADNEPYVASARAEMWRIGRDFVQEEIARIRAGDPQGRPVVVNQAQERLTDRYTEQRAWILEDADVLAISFYPFRDHRVFGIDFVVPIPELGPIHPNYAAHARDAHDAGRGYWITELQGEPWAHGDVHAISPENPSRNLTPTTFRRSFDYARRTGADRVYLWGAEWWFYQQERYGDSRWMETARDLIR